jgi:hypothetical protein
MRTISKPKNFGTPFSSEGEGVCYDDLGAKMREFVMRVHVLQLCKGLYNLKPNGLPPNYSHAPNR